MRFALISLSIYTRNILLLGDIISLKWYYVKKKYKLKVENSEIKGIIKIVKDGGIKHE